MRASFGSVVAMALWLFTSIALASPSYPAVMDRALGLGCEPDCMVCHRDRTGFATVNTLLGRTLRRAGLGCCDDAELTSVLEQLRATAADSDGDGVTDVEELAALSDPSGGEEMLACGLRVLPDDDSGQPVFGACRSSPSAGSQPTFAVLALALFLLGARFMRRR